MQTINFQKRYFNIYSYKLMKQISLKLSLALLVLLISIIPSLSSYSKELKLHSLILKKNELPPGIQFGIVPPPVKKIIHSNPWVLDKKSIKKFSKAIYRHANHLAIKKMVMVILAPKTAPFNDDIVYYGFEFTNKKSAKIETSKLNEVVRQNKSRAILLSSATKTILLFSDNAYLYPAMKNISKLLQKKLDK